jgi:hypothetical protein
MPDMLEDLLARVARIEAKEAIISTFNEYLHYLDAAFVDDLLGLFATDAALELMNYPPGTGSNVFCNGHEEIRPVYPVRMTDSLVPGRIASRGRDQGDPAMELPSNGI